MILIRKWFWLILVIPMLGCSAQTIASPVAVPTTTPKETKVVFLPTITPLATATAVASSMPLPSEGFLYHGIYLGGRTGEEDDFTFKDLVGYENLVGKNATWVYFSNNWYRSRKFPAETALWIRNAGSIPYIRLMLRSEIKFSGEEPVYTLQNIIDGQFDDDLHTWCMAARDFGTHILVEYGTEVNSDPFPWSGSANGAGGKNSYGDPTLPDGPERFQNAYRHIVQVCRDEGAVNITWVFHVDSENSPDDAWNKIEYYYPGNEWVDWIGISIYGVHTPTSPYFSNFRPTMDRVHARILTFAPEKPIIISEFGSTKNSPFVDQVQWARSALTDIMSHRYKNVIGFSWWNEAWRNDSNPAHDTSMRIQDSPDLLALFQEMIGKNPNVIGKISK